MSTTNPKQEALLQLLKRYSNLDFSERVTVSDPSDPIDQIASELNKLVDIIEETREKEKKQFQVIAANHERYLDVAESFAIFIVRVDSNANIEYVSRVGSGFKLEEIIGTSVYNFIHPDSISLYKQKLQDVLNDGCTVKFITQGYRSDKTMGWHDVKISPIAENGKIVSAAITFIDVTERKLMEEKFSFQAQMVDLIGDYIIAFDMNDKIVYYNKAAERLFGYTRDEAAGTSVWDLVKEDKVMGIKGDIFRQLSEHGIWRGDAIIHSKHNTYIPVNSSAVYYFDENGQPAGVIGVGRDISKQIEQEKELISAKKGAEKSEKIRQLFVANMSHEIRTPLNAILGFQELLRGTPLTKEQQEYANAIDFAGRNLMVVINDVLDLSKIESGKFEFDETEFDLARLVYSAIELIAFRAKEKNLKISFSNSKEIPVHLIGDPSRLSQILLNLLSNSIKFTESGGITISTNIVKQTNTKITCSFSIEDTGIGIPEEQLNSIFEPFTQANPDTTRKYGGTGLGLTIVKQLVQLQHGQIQVQSEIGKGSVFSFTLTFKKAPLHKQQVLTFSTDTIETLPSNKQLSILLAEDILLNQLLVKKIMEKWSYRLDISKNGKEALEKFNSGNYDIILMDIQMPEMDGYTATQYIRQHPDPKKNSVPIIALTAHASKLEAERCITSGMNGFIAKPFESKDLLEMILKHTNQSAGQEGAANNHK
ncbi:MAG: PAS domain S-box protein [Bacteroidota bacterium]|nr:PAS domain S-box protein [Bacteroidota bacterium]